MMARNPAQRVPSTFRSTVGYVYFMQAGADGPIKIGFAVSPHLRIISLQTAHWAELRVLKIVRGTRKDEFALHLKFGHASIRGEWFWPTLPLLDYINFLDDAPKPNGTKGARLRHKIAAGV